MVSAVATSEAFWGASITGASPICAYVQEPQLLDCGLWSCVGGTIWLIVHCQ